nr:cytochrome P450 3A19-like [Maniola hyperantus]
MLFWNVVEERKKTENVHYKDLVSQLLSLREKLELPVGTDSKPYRRRGSGAAPVESYATIWCLISKALHGTHGTDDAATLFSLTRLLTFGPASALRTGSLSNLAELVDEILVAQAAAFIFGSVETSSSALSYCLHELAYHPEEQAKLYNEIEMAVKESGEDILDYNKLLELKYMTICINETLRKYPPLGYLDRVCLKEYKLNDHVTIEKGNPVFVNVLAIHYNEKYYPEPMEWRPERFSSYSETDNFDYTFIPFGEGPRICIGKRYGMMQMRAALSQLILKYKVEPAVPYPVTTDPNSYLLAPKNISRIKGYSMKLNMPLYRP